ncbi:hypothetical protein GCM10009662_44320 [Catellatospora coxensis]|uniref:Lipoprotein LpqN n=1 Tax=Catellatospora coxensis TaxID=310354 RepID=A0A8J3KN76_9ACTN|nr:hypothetical protein Cco03nite_23330 [Catellatospora coxensis]
MTRHRAVAATLVVALVTAIAAACSDDGDFAESGTATGVVVSGPNRARGGDLKISEAADPPSMPPGFRQVGKVTHIAGRLKDYVTITLPIPPEVGAAQLPELRVMRHDGKAWGAIVPQQIDIDRRQVKVTTNAFSLWSLSTWDVEQAAADFLAGSRNLLSSGGWWILGSVGKFAVNPPITECRYPALTLQIDLSSFVDDAIACPKFLPDDRERHTYRLHLSNLRGFPVMMRLPRGVTAHAVTPQAANPISQLLAYVGARHGMAVLPGGGELVLTVNALDLPKDARISGALDLTGVVLDTGVAIIRLVTGYEWNDEVIKAMGEAQEFADAVACVMDQSEGIAKRISGMSAGQLARELSYSAAACMSTELIVRAVSVYAKFQHQVYNEDQALQEALRTAVRRVVAIIENAPALTQIVATMLAARSGRTTFTLAMTLQDPAVDALYRALPTPGSGGFRRGYGPSAGPANGGQLTFAGTPCIADERPQSWAAWTHAAAYGRYDRDGVYAVSVQVAYIKPEHKAAVRDLFTYLAGSTARCEHRADGDIVELDNYDSRQYGSVTDYRVGIAGWENSESFRYGVAAAFDPTKSLVVHVSVSADTYADVDADDIKEALAEALDYVVNKLDVSLGTTYLPR